MVFRELPTNPANEIEDLEIRQLFKYLVTMRTKPNIIITGTPGVGKSSHSELLAENAGLKHLAINEVVKSRDCHDGWSDEYQSYLVDEDKLLDAIEDDVKQGGYIIDWHACEVFPKSWVDLVVVLRTDSTILYDRLNARYSKFPDSEVFWAYKAD